MALIFLKDCSNEEYINTLWIKLIADESNEYNIENENEIINILYFLAK